MVKQRFHRSVSQSLLVTFGSIGMLFRHDPWICVLLDRCYDHFVHNEAKRYAICSGVPWVPGVNGYISAESKARARA